MEELQTGAEADVVNWSDARQASSATRRMASESAASRWLTTMRCGEMSASHWMMRTSPLAKKFGWGFHFDAVGRVALCPKGSAEYDMLSQQTPKVLKALRSSRA